ncbi:MAG TPA: helix-turn-helix domain-containing protein [Burkholderiaceae bacterium]|nr:helix-turn-helix domain-containing protein [Burkholderiaceae bacterium]
MTETATTPGTTGLARSAGAQLRAAREKRGLHIAALAASMKVPQRKLEALEADRYDALPDLTFTRALAQSVCRALKVDAQPVLDALPTAADTGRLAQMGGGINAPFRDRPGRDDSNEPRLWTRPVFWGTALVLLAAATMALLPDSWLRATRWFERTTPAAAPVASATAPVVIATPEAAPPAAAASEVAAAPVGPAGAEPAFPPASTNAPPGAPSGVSPTGILQVHARAGSWVEVQDAQGQVLLSRHLKDGERVGVDGALPLRLTVGNATGTTISFRGQAVDLAPNTLGNVARLQLN